MCCARWKFDKVAVPSAPEACVVSLTDTVKPMLLNTWAEAPFGVNTHAKNKPSIQQPGTCCFWCCDRARLDGESCQRRSGLWL